MYFSRPIRTVFTVSAILCLLFTVSCTGLSKPNDQSTNDRSTTVDLDAIFSGIPTGKRWLEHLQQDLLPFWTTPVALEFPTYRCNDGSLVDLDNPCPELRDPVPGIVWLDREFVRAKARQVFAYGIAFHLTGDTKLLAHMKKGVNILLDAIDRDAGGVISYWQRQSDGSWSREPSPAQRRSQDMAYALSGLGFYYYLTRDEAVLKEVLSIKNYIFQTYEDPQWGLLGWVKQASPDGDQPDQRELVAQLDQVYGYMLWLAPTLPTEALRHQWYDDLTRLANLMIEQFYSPRLNLFWGAVTRPAIKRLGEDHVDFGHSVKTLWLIYQIGKHTDNPAFTSFASERAARILELAFDPVTMSWNRRILPDGTIDTDKEWWIHAELNQTSATLALLDPAYARYLPTSYRYWLEVMVDHRHGEIWHMVSGEDNRPVASFPKQHSWKNAFHSFEHNLVAYLTSQELHDLPIVLHFAFETAPVNETIHPYLFQAKLLGLESKGSTQTATFVDLR
jgi:mannose/cellobiose epimerase-like protein (N-acyl-D-glucosamine 2-epimerase family)